MIALPIKLTPRQLHDAAQVAQEVADAREGVAAAQARYQAAEGRALLVLRVYAELCGEDVRFLRVDANKGEIVLDIDAKMQAEARRRMAEEAQKVNPETEETLRRTTEALRAEAGLPSGDTEGEG